ncbi:MAG: iron-sulfur cluster assembly accessory protein [Alphaproteobacteria bacterium]|nr:iron-sulfur cluster assembly accessory protein [Alphaproteobacteria bacterium]MDD9920283.1 iron-sulfur cluster assembly accessory protein [Alphaproteobacteria bacterium]
MVKITFEAVEPPILKNAPDGSPFMLTDAAGQRLHTILQKHLKGTFLRVVVKGGGCNGYNYSFKLDQTPQEDDHIITHPTTQAAVHIDKASLALLHGSTLDYEDNINIAQFVINNPNATSSCGCGNSFGL